MAETKILIGGNLEEDAAAFLDAWYRAELGDSSEEGVLAFESWRALLAALSC